MSARPSAGARSAAGLRALAVILVVVGLDQLAKHTIGTSIQPNQTRHVIGSVLEFVYVRNTGVAFGVLAGGGSAVYIATALALGCLMVYLVLRPGRPWLWLPTGMMVGGAIGNLIDRVRQGSVIDFIKLPHWPAFNVADMAITFGVIALVALIEFGGRAAD
ncbi:MAG TPA: signal peptidase II [Solirubrobacteraceae bacterium]|nr:signal peptidase II [Solirubrobacteraceae bacterium]